MAMESHVHLFCIAIYIQAIVIRKCLHISLLWCVEESLYTSSPGLVYIYIMTFRQFVFSDGWTKMPNDP